MECPECHHENPADTVFCGKCGTRFGAEAQPSVTRTLETPAEETKRGTVFAERYEILEELGEGGMGRVLRAYDRKLEEEVALKIIRPEIAANRKMIERFKNELKNARRIAHKHVCKMYDLGEEGKTSFITMEYVPGEDLKSFIRRSGQLTSSKAITIASQICEGLGEAHRLGIVHRDLKPQNIMIDKEGSAKIMDFGIARTVESSGKTEAGTIIGTPEYMSPEQAEGKQADRRSDIYSLGIILYEMVTGRVPFQGETALAVAHKHRTETPPHPKKTNPDIPDSLADLILRCLEKDPAKRFKDTGSLLDALLNFKAGLGILNIFKRLLLPAAVGVVIVGIGLLLREILIKPSPPVPIKENSIAVISFENMTGDSRYDDMIGYLPHVYIHRFEGMGFSEVTTWERLQDLI